MVLGRIALLIMHRTVPVCYAIAGREESSLCRVSRTTVQRDDRDGLLYLFDPTLPM